MGKHSEWRKLAKKLRRKLIRQRKAQLRDQNEAEEFNKLQNSPSYQVLLIEKLQADNQKALDEEKLHEARQREWLRTEAEAQKQFEELQKKLALAREERARQNEKIRIEWEEEQKQREEVRKEKELELEEKIREEELLQTKVEDFIEYGGDTPEHLKTVLETNPNKPICQFFNKTSTCRFYDVCSRNHVRPGISKILLIPNFFSHYSLEKTEHDQFMDSNLEFENHEVNQCYREFFKDVVPELKTYGKISLFVTCCNHESHLRGNVFVEFYKTQAALKCYRGLNGRWYGGKQLSVQFVNILNWNSAICGVYFTNRCPKGSSCNFMHTFRNPGNSYSAYQKIKRDTHSRQRNNSESTNCRWSESPERSASKRDTDSRHRNNSESRNWRWSESPEQTSTKNDNQSSRSSHGSVKNGIRRKKRSKSRERSGRSHSNKYKKKDRKRKK